MTEPLPESIITLSGLFVSIVGSLLLFKNSRTPQFMKEDENKDLTFRTPSEMIRERKVARVGFGLVFLGLMFQALAVALPLLPKLSRLSSRNHTDVLALIIPRPPTFASESQRGFYAVDNLKPGLGRSDIQEAIRSMEYNNWTSTQPSEGFTVGVYIGGAVRLGSLSTPQFSQDEVSEASKTAQDYARTVYNLQAFHGLTDDEMNYLAPSWAMDIVRGLKNP